MQTTLALCVGVALTLSAPTQASVVTFYNLGNNFSWEPQYPFEGVPGRALDLTQDATQLNAPSNRSVWVERGFHSSPFTVVAHSLTALPINASPSLARFARSTTPTTIFGVGGVPQDVFAIQRFSAGDLIGPGLDWQSTVTFQQGSNMSGTQLPTARAFVGVEFPMADGIHYGFIEMSFTRLGVPPVYSWGYETQPNRPFIVPAPGSSLLALASLIAFRRRRTM